MPSPAATAAHTSAQAGQGVTVGERDGEGERDAEGDADFGVDEGVALEGVREAEGETTGEGGASEGAGTLLVPSDGGMVALAQALSAAKVAANSADEAEALA